MILLPAVFVRIHHRKVKTPSNSAVKNTALPTMSTGSFKSNVLQIVLKNKDMPHSGQIDKLTISLSFSFSTTAFLSVLFSFAYAVFQIFASFLFCELEPCGMLSSDLQFLRYEPDVSGPVWRSGCKFNYSRDF